jgi:urease accessory protein UreF
MGKKKRSDNHGAAFVQRPFRHCVGPRVKKIWGFVPEKFAIEEYSRWHSTTGGSSVAQDSPRAAHQFAPAEGGRRAMIPQPPVPQQVVEDFLGDVAPLAERLGSAEGLVALSSGDRKRFQRVTDLSSLRCFLLDYQSTVLVPLEWPAICQAYGHASRYEIRELIELDRQLDGEPALQSFATASQRVGKTQLKRLRPLRDQRLVQRYLHAVQTGEARAWHTVVYGVILALYSLPLRQSLLSYAQQTTVGFIRSAAGSLRLTDAECEALACQECSGFAEAVNRLLLAVGPKPLD